MMKKGHNHERRWRRLKVLLWLLASSVVLFCLGTIVVLLVRSRPPYSSSYEYDVYYSDNIVCRGIATADGSSLKYSVFSVLEWKEDRLDSAKSPVSLLVDGKEYNIVEITPTILNSFVGEGETIKEDVDAHNIKWVIIDNYESDSQIRYKITFTFDNNKVSRFSFFQNAPSVVESRYRITLDKQLLPALPTDLKEMEKILSEPISIEKMRKH